MNTIKFSHNYLKLPKDWQGKKATLLFVREIELEKQTKEFLEHDTIYATSHSSLVCRHCLDPISFKRDYPTLYKKYEKEVAMGIKQAFYPLPSKGKYLLLLFECEGTIFTTLRRSYESKLTYYGIRVGQEFELVKTEEEKT